jgi:hypothetical protein
MNGMAQTRQSTAGKCQGHSVRQEDGNNLLGLQRNFVDRFQRKEHQCECCVLCIILHVTQRYQGWDRNIEPWSSSAPLQSSGPHSRLQ